MPRLCPVPRHDYHRELYSWADAVDEKDTIGPRTDIGELMKLCTDSEKEQIELLRNLGDEDEVRGVVRGAIGRRILETPGCVATQDGPLNIPITIGVLDPHKELPEHVNTFSDDPVTAAFETLRTLWELPNGRPIALGLEMYNHARRIGLGYWATWDPPPPVEWYDARREWGAWSREKILHNRRGFDSEKAIKDAVRSGLFDDGGRLAAWEAVEPSYDPEQHILAEWLSDELVHAVQNWIDDPGRRVIQSEGKSKSLVSPGGIIWTQDTEVGVRLERDLGIPYYGPEGLDRRGRFILDHPKGQPMVASSRANRTGRNLQHGWSDNLWLCTPEEQGLARTHRQGQTADASRNWLHIGCREHVSSFWRAVRLARATEQQLKQAMRLCYAEITVPELHEVEGREGPRWRRSAKR
jgi:hypothetical protein